MGLFWISPWLLLEGRAGEVEVGGLASVRGLCISVQGETLVGSASTYAPRRRIEKVQTKCDKDLLVRFIYRRLHFWEVGPATERFNFAAPVPRACKPNSTVRLPGNDIRPLSEVPCKPLAGGRDVAVGMAE